MKRQGGKSTGGAAMDEPRSDLGDIGFGYRPRAPYASDPARSRGRFYAETGKPDPHAVPARPRPHHPFDRLPPAEAQDAGVRRRTRATTTARG